MPASMKDFRVLQLLGKGSYGSVYKCKRKSDGHTYAVKEVNIRKLSPREREDAVNEIRFLASIRHENIVRYCEAFVERDNLYIVMEFAEHGDVHSQIKKFKVANKYIKETTIWSYLIQICSALDELHSRNILHRDIKPQNIFLTDKNHIRLGDLGCAKLMKSGMARTQIGTPYYMSPEIWANRPYDTKSDMWAVGCFIYELCALRPPFLANDVNGLARRIKTQAAPRISKHYSDDLATIVARLLCKNPASRPSISQVMTMPSVQQHMNLLPSSDPSRRWTDNRDSELLATIKVPALLGRPGIRCNINLPDAAYPNEADTPESGPPASVRSENQQKVRRPSTSSNNSNENAARSRPVSSGGSRPSAPHIGARALPRAPSRPRLVAHVREPSKVSPAAALAEARAKGYRNGGIGLHRQPRRGAEPLKERDRNIPYAAREKPSKQPYPGSRPSHPARSEAAARRPAGAVRRYASAAQAVHRIPAPPVNRRQVPSGFARQY